MSMMRVWFEMSKPDGGGTDEDPSFGNVRRHGLNIRGTSGLCSGSTSFCSFYFPDCKRHKPWPGL